MIGECWLNLASVFFLLVVALQRDEFEEVRPLSYEFPDRDVPAAPLRLANDEDNDLVIIPL